LRKFEDLSHKGFLLKETAELGYKLCLKVHKEYASAHSRAHRVDPTIDISVVAHGLVGLRHELDQAFSIRYDALLLVDALGIVDVQEQGQAEEVYREHDRLDIFEFGQEVLQDLLPLQAEQRIDIEPFIDSEGERGLLEQGEPLTGLLVVGGILAYEGEGA